MTEAELHAMLVDAFRELRVHSFNRDDHSYRWSVTDLATDLAPLLLARMDVRQDSDTPQIVG